MFNSDISPISSVSSTTSTATTATTSNHQQITAASAANAKTSDSVSISPQASQALEWERQEQYKPKNATDLFNDWLASGREYPVLVLPRQNGSEDELLPENQPLLENLRDKMSKTTDPHERMLVSLDIKNLLGWGNQEIFKNESDLDQRFEALNDSHYLQQKYLVEKYGDPMGVPSEEMQQRIDELKNDPRFNVYPRLSELTGKTDSRGSEGMYSNAPQEAQALFESKGYDLSRFSEDDFLLGLLNEKAQVDEVVSKRQQEIMSDFNHPYWETSLKEKEGAENEYS